MGFGALRSVIRPVLRTLLSNRTTSAFSPLTLPASTSPYSASELHLGHPFGPLCRHVPWIPPSTAFHSLTDTRYPKRRPSDKPRRKRASLRPPGPYTWVKYKPGEPILPNQPNKGSVKRRNEKKRIKLQRAFILELNMNDIERQPHNSLAEKKAIGRENRLHAEKKKRIAQLQEANRKKIIKRVERKMAAVARERSWAQRLIKLMQLEEEKKKAAKA